MKTLTILSALLLLSVPAAAQNANSATTAAATSNAKTTRRGPVFRANKEQIKQARVT